MSLAAAARVFAAIAVLPLGGWSVRVVVAAVFALAIGTLVPDTGVGPLALAGELALGAAMGLLAGLPVYAARALRSTGAPSAALLGQTWLWALFFTAGGAGLSSVAGRPDWVFGTAGPPAGAG